MEKLIVLSVLMTAVGCSGAALPSADDAMAIVWEGSYGMEIASRPHVEWFDGCRTAAGGNLQEIASTTFDRNHCIVAIVHNDGRVELARTATISDSRFAAALRQWKQWLLLTDMTPHWNPEEVDAANVALEQHGL